MSKHTPGPWRWKLFYDKPGSANLPILFGSGDVEVCNFGTTETYYPESGCEPEEPDMILIAAAPEMLEVLETIKRRMYEPRALMLEDVELMIDKVIAKAKGDQP